jgi:hypothetical protein
LRVAEAAREIKVIGHHADDADYALWDAHREIPRVLGAEILTDDERAFRAEGVEYAQEVGLELRGIVVGNLERPLGSAIAAAVDGRREEAGARERGKLMAPAIPKTGITVHHQDQRSLALIGDVHVDTVGPDRAM